MAGGAVLIAIFGAIGEPAHNLDQLLVLLGRGQFVLWMIGQAALVVAIIVGAKAMKLMNPWTSNSPRMRLFRGMAYGCISGILSAHSLLVAKSAVELLVRTIVDKQNQFNRWQSWVILLGLLALALSQLYYLHRGLKLCSTSILYPFVFCVYNIIAILDGLIYFNQSSRLPVLHALLVSWDSTPCDIRSSELLQIALGTIILLAGVLALSWRLNDDPSTRPTLNQPPLTPGMGFADDSPTPTPTSTSPSSPTLSTITDEEIAISANGKPSPYLHPRKHSRHTSLSNPRTPIAKHSAHLYSNRHGRDPVTESEEIWEELADDTLSPLLSGFHQRRSSARSTPSGDRQRPGSCDGAAADSPTESTALLARTGTGRSYRDRRRRRSAPHLEGLGRSQTQERRRSSVQQDALGGWWKMRWWKKGRDEGDGRGEEG